MFSNMTRRVVPLLVGWIVFSFTMMPLASERVPDASSDAISGWGDGADPAPSHAQALTIHEPIFIDGDIGFTNESGVVRGSGTESDPFVIEGWEINASTAHGIALNSTRAHFVIMACHVYDASKMNICIFLQNCTNGTVEDNYCDRGLNGLRIFLSRGIYARNNTFWEDGQWGSDDGVLLSCSDSNFIVNNTCIGDCGIALWWSNSNTVADNVCSPSGLAIGLDSSHNNTVADNYCHGYEGMHLRESDGNIIDGNDCDGLHYGMYLSACDNNLINDNICVGVVLYSIEIYASTGNTVSNNTCHQAADSGILLERSSHNSLVNNNCSFCQGAGIMLRNSDNNTLTDNTCVSWEYLDFPALLGIGLDDSSNCTLYGNNCSLNFNGIALYASHDNTLVSNDCSMNTREFDYGGNGVSLYHSARNNITSNVFSSNILYGVEIQWGSHNQIWNNTFVGNNGATEVYNASHAQAYDDGTANWWNSSEGLGNWWSDWTGPDYDANGIVDLPYNISGGAKDYFPRTNTPTEPIPEFGAVPSMFMILVFAAMLVALSRRNKEKL